MMWGEIIHQVLASVCQHSARVQARNDRRDGVSPNLRSDRERGLVDRDLVVPRYIAQQRVSSGDAQGSHPVR